MDRAHIQPADPLPPSELVRRALAAARTSHGESLLELSERNPVLAVFLRHAGCTFCRKTLASIAARRASIEHRGVKIVLVHLGDDSQAARLFGRYGLDDLPRVADPHRKLYEAVGLRRGSLVEVLSPRLWWHGFRSAIVERHGFGGIQGDVRQLPGAALIYRGQVCAAIRSRSAADVPDVEGLTACELRASAR
jgi:hypothetical protein